MVVIAWIEVKRNYADMVQVNVLAWGIWGSLSTIIQKSSLLFPEKPFCRRWLSALPRGHLVTGFLLETIQDRYEEYWWPTGGRCSRRLVLGGLVKLSKQLSLESKLCSHFIGICWYNSQRWKLAVIGVYSPAILVKFNQTTAISLSILPKMRCSRRLLYS